MTLPPILVHYFIAAATPDVVYCGLLAQDRWWIMCIVILPIIRISSVASVML